MKPLMEPDQLNDQNISDLPLVDPSLPDDDELLQADIEKHKRRSAIIAVLMIVGLYALVIVLNYLTLKIGAVYLWATVLAIILISPLVLTRFKVMSFLGDILPFTREPRDFLYELELRRKERKYL